MLNKKVTKLFISMMAGTLTFGTVLPAAVFADTGVIEGDAPVDQGPAELTREDPAWWELTPEDPEWQFLTEEDKAEILQNRFGAEDADTEAADEAEGTGENEDPPTEPTEGEGEEPEEEPTDPASPGQTDGEEIEVIDDTGEPKTDPTEGPEEVKESETEKIESADETPEPEIIVRPGTGSRVIVSPTLVEDYHFWQIGKVALFARQDMQIVEEKDENSRAVGTIFRLGVMYRIHDEEDGWFYVESGDVRGFVKSKDVYQGKTAEKIQKRLLKIGGASTDEEKANFDWSKSFASPILAKEENKAYAYYRATTRQVVVDKLCADVETENNADLNVYEGQGGDQRIVGTVAGEGYVYVLEDNGSDWLYVESGDLRGFAKRSDLGYGRKETKAEAADEAKGKAQATIIVDPEDNKAYYYTLTSVEAGKPNGQIGESLVEYASNYIGNPYVWGGTSLTDGADCSGFVQSVYAQYGIELPRVAEEQAMSGSAIPITDAMPGDLIFYQDENGYIFHVMIYAGDGQTVEAHNSEVGIIEGDYDAASGLDYAVRVLDQSNLPVIHTTDGATEIIPQTEIGGLYTYERWDRAWDSGTYQKALHDLYENYDEEGFGKIGDRYVIACTTTFGNVGDLIDFELDDGTVIKTVMGDAKNQSDSGCSIYGHLEGSNVIEFIVNGVQWDGHENAGNTSCHLEWGGKQVVRAVNYGNIIG